MARSFNGTSDRITFGDVIDLNGLTNFTLHAWIFPTTVSVQQRIISKWGAGVQYLLQLTSAGKLELVAHDASGHQPLRDSTPSVSANAWSQVAGIMKGAAPTNMFLCINGVATGGSSSGTSLSGGIQNTTQPLCIGDDAGAGATAPFHGRIAHAAIWSVALADTELVALGAGILPPHVRPESLQAYWPLAGVDSPEPAAAGAVRQAGTLTGTSLGADAPVHPGVVELV